jgi:hypothetical protein
LSLLGCPLKLFVESFFKPWPPQTPAPGQQRHHTPARNSMPVELELELVVLGSPPGARRPGPGSATPSAPSAPPGRELQTAVISARQIENLPSAARERDRGNSEICQVAFTSGPNNFPATKACLQLPYDIQSDPRHNWRFKFSSTRRHSLEWSPYMTPKFLGLHGCCSLGPKKSRAPACT